jgi:four helix bundle protein
MTNFKLNLKSKTPNPNNNKKYDLKDRKFRYIIDVLDYLDRLPSTLVNRVIVGQCTRSVTYVGVNYEEADSVHTKKDFSYKMEIMRKEAKETRFWLKVSLVKNPTVNSQTCELLRDEGLQLVRIFSTIINKSKN